MLHKTRAILAECQETWPLARGWLTSIDRFIQDQHSTTPMHEGSMADGRDPVPNVLSQEQPSRPRYQGPPLAQKQRPLPPVQTEHPTPTASHDMSSSFSGSTYSQHTPTQHNQGIPHAYLSPPEQHPQIPQPHPPHHAEAYVEHSYMAPDPNLMHAQSHAMYYHRPHHGDGLDLLIDASQQQPHMASAYDMAHAAPIAAPSDIPYFAELGPSTDGFDDNLQHFANNGAHPADMQPNGWMNGYHRGPMG